MLTRVEGYNYPLCVLCMCVYLCMLSCVCTSKRQCDRERKSGYMNGCRAAHFVILLYLLAFVGCGLCVCVCAVVYESETDTFSLEDDFVWPNLLYVCVLLHCRQTGLDMSSESARPCCTRTCLITTTKGKTQIHTGMNSNSTHI